MHNHHNQLIQRRFIISLTLTGLIFIAEVIGGLLSGSLALLSDAAHVFMDIFALALSFVALRVAQRPVDERHSFGWNRVEVIAAFINGASLFVISIGIWIEAIKRFNAPVEIHSSEMLIIAAIGLLVNVVVAVVLGAPGHSHTHEEGDTHDETSAPHQQNLNVRSAFLHVLGDAISSVGVIVAALVIRFTGAEWVDPLISVVIGVIIFVSAFRVLRSAVHILLEGVPEGLSFTRIKESIAAIDAVEDVHDLHIWNLGSEQVSLSAHVVVKKGSAQEKAAIMQQIKTRLNDDFHIQHTTIQFEQKPCLDGHGGCN